jgi:hypothetical protein
MPIAKNNFATPNVASEFEGVDVAFVTVDFINSMAAEITDPLASANTAGLALVKEAIQNQGVNIIGHGSLAVSNTEMTYMVRADSLDTISSTTTASALQTAIQALNTNSKITANIGSATVTVNTTGASDTGVNAA